MGMSEAEGATTEGEIAKAVGEARVGETGGPARVRVAPSAAEVAVPAHCSRVALVTGMEKRSPVGVFWSEDDETLFQTRAWRGGTTTRGRRGSHPGGRGGTVQ
jgi:hypothetical protein